MTGYDPELARGVIGRLFIGVMEKAAWLGETGCGGELVGK
jgi:hypothetical protein